MTEVTRVRWLVFQITYCLRIAKKQRYFSHSILSALGFEPSAMVRGRLESVSSIMTYPKWKKIIKTFPKQILTISVKIAK